MRQKSILTFAAALLSAWVCTACGNKIYPAPENADRFSFAAASLQRRQNCAVISATLTGSYANIAGVSLLVEKNGCPDCPFQPTVREEYGLRNPSLTLKGDSLTLVRCGLDPDPDYRFQLLGQNLLRLPAAKSQVLSAPAAGTPGGEDANNTP